MGKLIWGILLIASGAFGAGNVMHSIVVAYGKNNRTMQAVHDRLKKVLRDDTRLATLVQKSHAHIERTTFGDRAAVGVGPFAPDIRFAEAYLILRSLFPGAVVIERQTPLPQFTSPSHAARGTSSTRAASTPPRLSAPPARLVNEESGETIIWIALFGLALIGILYMYLSSDQLRRIKREHAQIEARQKALEIKQHAVLAQMGENIHTLAQETVNRTQLLAEKARDGNLGGADVERVIESENELLGISSDLIKFLQIKAHKVTIRNAPFDINNVLNEIAGTLQGACRASDKELIFDVAKNVPRQIESDSLHMTQVLSNIIEHLMCHTESRVVRLRAHYHTDKQRGHMLEVTLRADADLSDEESLFDAHYDETTQKYYGLGMFVARELLELMGGRLALRGGKEPTTEMVLTFPAGDYPAERRQYRLQNREMMGKKVLIVDRNPDALKALHRFLDYFHLSVTEMSVASFSAQASEIAQYDMAILDNALFDPPLLRRLESIRREKPLRVVSLENLYASTIHPVGGVVDSRMKKPLTQQHILDMLLQLDQTESESTAEEPASETVTLPGEAPEVYRDDFEDRANVGLEDFARFAGAHLLIVEDNLLNQKVLQGILAKAEMTLTVANNGQEALDQLDRVGDTVDLILMDISMPVMDGFTATQKIHEQERFRRIPIVTLTALVSDHEVEKMFASGANGYFAKPLKIGKLYSVFARFLGEKQPERENAPVSAETEKPLGGEKKLVADEAVGAREDNAILYHEVLREFQEYYGNSDSVFEKLIRDKRYEQLRILCVDLRGVTGTIGAQRLHEVISDTLTMLIYRKYDLLERYITPYRKELSRLNRAIETYLS